MLVSQARDGTKCGVERQAGAMSAAVAAGGERAARARQAAIRDAATDVQQGMNRLFELIDEAQASGDHLALGYASWTAYAADTFPGGLQLDRSDRQAAVARLSGMGMSTRAIAPIVGVGLATVHRDRAAGVPDGTPVSPPRVAGLDGKLYARPAPREPSQAVTDYLADDRTLQDLEYVRNFLKALRPSLGLVGFDAERLADLLDDNGVLLLRSHVRGLSEFLDTVTTKRSSLRVISGGRA